jgi:DNA primase
VLVPLDLAVERDGRLRDRFYERVTFPICDRLGLPIAFSARLLPEAERRAKEEGRGVGKYINSTDTPLYHKGKAVFNLHQARQAVKDAGFLAVMEGPTDVMAAWQAGLTSCVAVLGTALTPEHAKVLGQTTAGARLVLLFDGDRAGQTNALKAVRTCLAAGVSCSVAALPDDLDPSELLTEEAGAGGIARLREVLDRARDGLGHLLRGTVPSPYSMPRDQLAAAARGLADAIRAIPDPQARTLAVREAEQWLGFPLALRNDTPAAGGPTAPATAKPLDPKRDVVLHVLLRHPDQRAAAGDEHQMEPADWPEPWTEVAGLLLCDPGAGGDALRALSAAQDPEISKRIGWWLANGLDARTPPVDDPAAALADAAPRLLRDRLRSRRAELQRTLADAERDQDPARIMVLAEELSEVSTRLADLGG